MDNSVSPAPRLGFASQHNDSSERRRQYYFAQMSVECYRGVLLKGVVAPGESALETCGRSCTLSAGFVNAVTMRWEFGEDLRIACACRSGFILAICCQSSSPAIHLPLRLPCTALYG